MHQGLSRYRYPLLSISANARQFYHQVSYKALLPLNYILHPPRVLCRYHLRPNRFSISRCYSTAPMTITSPIPANDPETNILNLDHPISDKRIYRHVVLHNKLEALLISDPESDRSACALNVGVGSLFDPTNLPGLAHFLEHMVNHRC